MDGPTSITHHHSSSRPSSSSSSSRTMSTFNSAKDVGSYEHDDRIIAAGFHQLDMDFLSQRLQERSPRKSRLISYFDGFMEFAKPPPSLSPSPMTSRCSSPSRESVSHSSESDHSNAADGVVVVKPSEKAHKTQASKFKRHLVKNRTKRGYRIGKKRNLHAMKTRSKRRVHRLEGLR